MIPLNYSVYDSNNVPVPLGTKPIVTLMGDGWSAAKIWADPVNAGRFQISYSKSGTVTVGIQVPGVGYKVFDEAVPTAGPIEAPSGPVVLIPLS